MTTSRLDGPEFPQFTMLPSELQQYIGSFLDKTSLLNLATRSKSQLHLHQHEIMRRFMAAHRVVQIRGTADSTFFLTAEGFLYACGMNSTGNLGMGDREPRIIPTRVPNIPPIKKILSRAGSLLLDRDGVVWKLYQNSMVPIEDLVDFDLPWQDSPVIVDSSRFNDDYLLLSDDGNVYARGNNVRARFANLNDEQLRIFTLVPAVSKIKKISLAHNAAFYIDEAGAAFAGGANEVGQLALGNCTPSMGINRIPELAPESAIQNIWSDGSRTYIQLTSDEVYACGRNDIGQLGIGIVTHRCVHPALIPELKNIKKIVFYSNSAYAITHDGQVFVWGENNYGQLALGDQKNRVSPTLIPDLLGVKKIDFYEGTLFFYTYEGSTYLCGRSLQIWPGMNTGPSVSTRPVLAPLMHNAISVVSGFDVYTFLRDDGVVVGWGSNNHHALGLEEDYYTDIQMIELPPVRQHLQEVSLAVLLHYANQGQGYYHEVCFSLALDKLRAELTPENVQIALPALRAHRHEDQVKALLPGCDKIPAYTTDDFLQAYAQLLCAYAQLPGTMRSAIERQRDFFSIMQKIIEPLSESESDENEEKKDRHDKREILRSLSRFGMFTKNFEHLSIASIKQAAEILADSIAMPALPEKRRAEELEPEREVKKFKGNPG